MIRRLPLILLAALVLLPVAGCGDDRSGDVTVSGVWARASAGGQTAGAAYMRIEGGDEDDRLLAASAPDSVAAVTELHETVSEDDEPAPGAGAHSGMDMGGSMTMREVAAIEVPAGETVDLEPGGYHVMLLQLTGPLEVGDAFDLTLTFEEAGERVVEVEVRE